MSSICPPQECVKIGAQAVCVCMCVLIPTLLKELHTHTHPPTSTHPDTNHDWHTDAYRKRWGAESGTEWHSSRLSGMDLECLTVPTHEDTQRQMVLKGRATSVEFVSWSAWVPTKKRRIRERMIKEDMAHYGSCLYTWHISLQHSVLFYCLCFNQIINIMPFDYSFNRRISRVLFLGNTIKTTFSLFIKECCTFSLPHYSYICCCT